MTTPRRRPTVLIADDDLALARAIATRLQAEGYEVITSQDAYQALERARRTHPDLMILDVNMPAGTGFSVLERIGNIPELAGTPVLFVSGDPSPDLERAAESLGALGVIRKPFETRWLLNQIGKALDRAASAAVP